MFCIMVISSVFSSSYTRYIHFIDELLNNYTLDAPRFLFLMFAYSWFHFSFDVIYCFGKVEDDFV
jgi:hypothetical protein